MKDLGETLKQSRIKQNKSITDISEITKMNINIISNIEAGNVDYFRNDLTYLKYYIKSYMVALGEDLEDIDNEISDITLEYTQSISVIEKDKLAEINEKINKKSTHVNYSSNQPKKVKNIDWTFVSLISIVALIGLFLVYSVVANIINKPETPEVKPPIVNKPDEEDNGEEEIPPVIEKAKVEVKFDTDNSLTVSNWDESTTFETKFSVDTWVQIMINNQIITLPQKEVTSKVFVPNEELILSDFYIMNGEEIPFKEGDVISIRYGIMKGNEFLIDDEKLKLEASVAEANGGTDLVYTLGKRAEK